jgi:predicted nucleic acid-binding protein
MTEFKKIFIDTAPFIYYIEGSLGNPEYSNKIKNFLKYSYDNNIKLTTSVITVEEYNVFPYKTRNLDLIHSFERLIKTLDIDVLTIDKTTADTAAKIRANYKSFKAMDALQLASAFISGCNLFLTNDKQLLQFNEIECITVDEL